jgi:hypothetical protein
MYAVAQGFARGQLIKISKSLREASVNHVGLIAECICSLGELREVS